jgi:hypothetical protein
MKSKLLLTASLTITAFAATAQQSNKAWAITGDGNKDFMWMNVRQINLSTGKVEKTLFQRSKTNFTLTDAVSKKTIDQTAFADKNIYNASAYPTATMVAGAAYDKRSNRLYFIPMRMGELRWIDLDNKSEAVKFYSMSSPELKVSPTTVDEANNITRMVIAADGNGYAITNDGNSLVKFTTGRKPVISNLGNLIDDEKNSGLSIHNKCSSWGGDMVADAFGKLYVISATHNVFEVDIKSRIATFRGTISGLPANYTTNGAAVDAEGNIVVSSANAFEGYYRLKLADLAATRIEGSDVVYNASDLANGNLLLQKEADEASKFASQTKMPVMADISADSKIYPNPVTTSSFKVLFDGKTEGTHTIIVTDIAGRGILSKKTNLVKGQQTETVNLNNKPTKGTYMVKVLNDKQQVIMTEKMIIQ